MTPVTSTCIVALLCTVVAQLALVLIALACIYSVLLRIRERMR